MKKVILALLVLLVSISSFAEGQTRFLVVTDIHFDPFTACYEDKEKPCSLIIKLKNAAVSEWPAILSRNEVLPTYKQDSPYQLLASSLKAAQEAGKAQHVKFVLVLGDLLGHNYRKNFKKYADDKSRATYLIFVRKTFQFLNNEFARAFPNIDVYSVVGNNDSYGGNYKARPGDIFFSETGNLWSSLIKNSANRTAMQQDFKKAGYYAIDLPGQKNLRLIALNTVLFSVKTDNEKINQAAADELTWFHDELQRAKEKHQHVIIALHIPDAIDVYASLRIRLFRIIELWHPQFTDRFQNDLQDYAGEIEGIFAGHLHADWFQVLRFDNLNEIPVLGTPSISPVYGNNPGFKIYSYSNDTLKLADFITYYYPLTNPSEWKVEYDFSHLYKPNCLSCPITSGMNALQSQGALAEAYKRFYSVNTESQPITKHWNPYYWCAINEVRPAPYQKCIG